MALAYLLSPTFQIENSAGKPATGGYIEVYQAGSRNKYYCASDFDGTLLPFRIPLDSLGSNVILADDSQAYDVYVYNRYGGELMSRYNVRPGAGGGGIGSLVSTDESIIITTTDTGATDIRTNTTPPSILRATAQNLSADGQFVFIEVERDGQNAVVDNNGRIIVNEGWWHYDAIARIRWPGNPEVNETQSISIYTRNNVSDSMTFDLSYAHSETVQVSGEYKATENGTQLVVGITGMAPGMTVELIDFGIHSIVGEGAGGKYNAGEGIVIDEPNRVISIDPDVVQEKLTAGTGISIDENNVISVTEDVDNDFVTVSPVVAPPDGSGLFIEAGIGLRERVLDYKYYELPAIQVAGSETESTYIVAAPWKFRTLYDINTNTSVSNMSAVGFFLYANVPGGSANLANCVVEWSVDKNHTAYLRSKTLVVPTYTSETPYVPCNAQDYKRGGYFFTFPTPSSAFVDKMLEDDRFDAGGDWSGYSGARGTMYFALYNTVTHQYMSLPKTDGEKMAVQKQYNLQVDYTKVQPRLTAGSNITITDNVISATAEPQVQADWAQSDTTAVDYIKNKPDLSVYATQTDLTNGLATKQDVISDLATIRAGAEAGATAVQDADYHHTDNNYTDADVAKLSGIEAGAQVNVQSDWTEANTSAESFILHKPEMKELVAGSNITITEPAGSNTVTIAASVPTVPVQDVQIDGTSVVNAQGIAEVPRQVNADWSSSAGASEILNKPNLATVATSGDYNDLSNLPSIQAPMSAGTNIDITNDTISVDMTASSTSANAREAISSVSQSADGTVSASARKVVGSEWTMCQVNSASSSKFLKIAEFNCYSGFRYVGSGYTDLVVKVCDADDARMYTVGVGIIQAANGNHNFSAAMRSKIDYLRGNATQPIKSFYLFSDKPYGDSQVSATLSLWVEFDTIEYNMWTFEAVLNTVVGGTGSDYAENAWTFADGKRSLESALPTGGWQLNSGAPVPVNVPTVGSGDNGKVLTASYDSNTYTARYSWQTPPSAPVTDVEVGGVSVVNAQGVAEVPSIPVIGTTTL